MAFIDYKIHFHHPANNFVKGDLWGDRSEHEFGNRFADTFGKLFDSNVIAIRELPVPGSGIADFVVIKNNKDIKTKKLKTVIQSFEFKLSDWRSGLMQAHRYKYFSNSSVLVIPAHKIKTAHKSLDLFKQLGVGLWSFNISSCVIIKEYTPRPMKVMDIKRTAYIINKALEANFHN